jgi:1-phosphatidylinositol phosphodiesterase
MTLDLANWMDLVKGSKKLSELSIPGTHDSGARDPDTSNDLQKIRLTTQDQSILQQLFAGIRFLDIRARYIDNEFRIYHEDVSLKLSFEDVLSACQAFLEVSPRETIIMSLKEESTATGNREGVSFYDRFIQYVDEGPAVFSLANADPLLGSVRGQIVLFRRFPLDAGVNPLGGGINAYPFENDATFVIDGPPRLMIQDEFEVLVSGELGNKYNRVKDLLDKASGPLGRADTLYVNFGSAAGGSLHTRPRDTAGFINPRLTDYFNEPDHQQGRFGIVVTDFETSALNSLIVRTNLSPDAGYWIVENSAIVTAFGTAETFASQPSLSDITAIAATPSGRGYYLVSRGGKVYAFGDAVHRGEGVPADTQAVAIAVKPDATNPTGPGYWILGLNGKVYPFNAKNRGEIEDGTNLQAASIAATPDGRGYWILASSGRIHPYGNAHQLDDRRDDGKTAVSMAATPDGGGYWILTSNGAVRAFGTATQYGQGVNDGATARSLAVTPDGAGYWIVTTDGNVFPYGSAEYFGRVRHASSIVGIAPGPRPPAPAPAGGTAGTGTGTGNPT